jgi:hypothetical protein
MTEAERELFSRYWAEAAGLPKPAPTKPLPARSVVRRALEKK